MSYRYRLAGALWDDLWYLASVNGLPLPASFAFSPRKNASRTIQACFEASDLPFNLSTGRHIHTEADPHNAPVGVSQGLGSIAGTQPPRTTMQATPRPLVGRAATGVSTPPLIRVSTGHRGQLHPLAKTTSRSPRPAPRTTVSMSFRHLKTGWPSLTRL
jgi:hypothetical protein